MIDIPVSVADNVTNPIVSMSSAVENLVRNFEQLQSIGANPIDPNGFSRAQQETSKIIGYQREYNEEVAKGCGLMENLKGKIIMAAGAYLSFKGVGAMLSMSDSMAQLDTRLDIMNDGLQTTDNLMNKIFSSAQSTRSSFADTAQVVTRLGTLAGNAFRSSDEIIGFATLMNKSFKLSGASIQEETAAMYQLTQAMASGRLQGDEFRSILENAPMLAQAIKKELNGIDMKKASSEGLITADVIKNAMFHAADDINKRFEQMPITFMEMMTIIKNNVVSSLAPMAKAISNIWNNKYVISAIAAISVALYGLGQVGAFVFNLINAGITFMGDHFSIVAPILIAVVGVFLAYKLAILGVTIAQGALAIAHTIASAAVTFFTIATGGATVAQTGLNAALMACPITWILLLIVAVIAVLFTVVALINHIANTHISVIGIIVGTLNVLLTVILNILKHIANTVLALMEFVINTWVNATYNIKKALISIQMVAAKVGKAVIGCFDAVANGIGNAFIWAANKSIRAINWIIEALNHIPGINLGKVGEIASINVHHSTAGLDNIIQADKNWLNNNRSKEIKLKRLEYGGLGDAYSKGYDIGKSFANGMSEKLTTLKNQFDPNKQKLENDKLLKGLQNQIPVGGGEIPSPEDAKKDRGKNGRHLKDINKNTKKTAENTARQGLDVKYLREIAERQAINRFTTAEIHIENTINEARTQDLDGFVGSLTDIISDQLEIHTEGYYK